MTSTSLIINVLIAYGALQGIFISLVLLRPKNKTLFNQLFSFLLIIEASSLIERLLVETELINSMPHLLGICYPMSFLKPPLMFFMALAITDKNFTIRRKSYLHFIPFAGMFLLNLPFLFLSGPEKLNTVNAFMNNIPSYQSFEFYFSLSFFLYIGVYIYLSLQKISQFRLQVVNNEAVNWYRIILLTYSSFLLLHLIYFVIQPVGQFSFQIVNQISMLAMTFIIQSIAFKLIDRSSLFSASPPDLSNLNQRKEHELLIITQLEENKIYLDDELSLEKFAESISLSPSYVSAIINQKFDNSFKKLIALHRVNEAKRIIKSSSRAKIKLIDVAFQSGFNNKVSFYRAFKEFEDLSPSEYLEKSKNEKN